MNKHLYRVIFNKARGLLMVVAENVSADGKAGASAAGAPGGLPAGVTVSMHPLRYALMLVLGLVLPGGALAAIVADASAPAHQQPSIIPTANGVPQIDIQTPSAAGVSRNTYSAFDVDPRGAILNNSRTDIQTQLGGWISGNQKLNNGTARIILNEVNSSAASHLNGYVEVAGDRAQVVIANPAGISCAGCGFINADRATLTTGAPIMNDGRLEGYAVSRGEVSIQGAGLDGRSTAYTDIIARSVRINAGIWANDLRVTTGSNRVDADHSQAVSLASLGDKPEFAIDVAHLGGMYAGKIRLVGTEHGVGVRNAGTLAAESGELRVTLNGRLENTGLLQGKEDIHLAIQEELNNDGGTIATKGMLALEAGALSNREGLIVVLGSAASEVEVAGRVDNSGGVLTSESDLSLKAGDLLNAEGLVYTAAGGNLRVQVDGTLDNALNGALVGGDSLHIISNRLNNQGSMEAATLRVQAADIDNAVTGEILGDDVRISATSTLINRGLIDGVKTRLEVVEGENIGTGRIYGDHLAIQAQTLINRKETVGDTSQAGTIAARERLDIGAQTLLNNDQALIFSAGISEDAFNIGGALDENGWAVGRADFVHNASAIIESLGGLNLAAARLLNSNEYFETVNVRTLAPTHITYIQPDGDTNKYHISQFVWHSWSRAGLYTFRGQEIKRWNQFEVSRTEYTTKVANTAPALIRSGGGMRLSGDELINDKSRIVVGGALTGDLTNLQNIDGTGTHRVHEQGTSQYTEENWRGGTKRYHERDWYDVLTYKPADIVTTINLDVVSVEKGVAPTGTSYQVPTQSSETAGPIDTIRDLPTSSLFKVSPGTGSFLVETDSRFTNQRTWLNSDYLLGQLSLDAAGMQQRIGDGFYEQWLIREQVSQLTGRRYLEGYGDDEAQYRSLMESGITVAQDWNLRPGVALSAEQVARLTSDIVWLVEESVRLPDGTLTTALVPKVYLVPRAGDLDGNGTLISAESIDLHLEGDLTNSGTIAGRSVVQLSGDNLRNLGGRITGEDVLLQARTDLENLGGTIDAQDSLLLSAGRDLTVASTTHTEQNSGKNQSASRTNLDRVAGLYVSNPGGTLLLAAGQDITLAGAEVVNAGAESQTLIAAGRDLTLAAVHTENQHASSDRVDTPTGNGLSDVFARSRPADSHREYQSQAIGTTLTTAGNLTLEAVGDLFAQAAQVRSDGNLQAHAGGDLLIVSATEQKSSNMDGQKTTLVVQDSTEQSSHFSAKGDLQLTAGNDLLLLASQLEAGGDASLEAGNNLSLLAGQNTHYSLYEHEDKGSYGSSSYQRDEVSDLSHVGSGITSGGNLTLKSGGDQHYQAANLQSGADLTLDSGGAIVFEGVKDEHQENHASSSNDWSWVKSSGKGWTDETLRQSALVAQGNLVIKAVEGIQLDIKEIDQHSVSQTIDAMVAADPQLAWLKEMEQRGDIDWQRVKEVHDSYEYDQQGMGPATALAVAIAVTAMSGGAAAGIANATAGAVGTGAVAAGVGAAAGAGFTAVTVQTAMSAINNGGDVDVVFKDVTSSDNVKGYATTMVTAGLTAGLYDKMLDTKTLPSGKVVTDLSSIEGVGGFAANQILQNTTQVAVSKALGQDASFNGLLKKSLIDSFTAAGFNLVGDIGEEYKLATGGSEMIALHALMGGLAAKAQGGEFATGALAAGVNEALVADLNKQFEGFDSDTQERLLLATSQLVGLLAAAVQDSEGDGSQLSVGANVAKASTQYNYLNHKENEERWEAKQGCDGGNEGDCARVDELDALDKKRDQELKDACRENSVGANCAANIAAAEAAVDSLRKEKHSEEATDQYRQAAEDPELRDYTLAKELRDTRNLIDSTPHTTPEAKALVHGLVGVMVEFSPAGGLMALADAEDPFDYVIAAVESVPAGKGVSVLIKEAKALYQAGKVDEAALIISDLNKSQGGRSTNLNKTSAITDSETGVSELPKVGSLKGEPEAHRPNANEDLIRSINRQNEAAKGLANAGYDVEQLPNTNKKGANPDLKINGDLADVHSPRTGSVKSVLTTVADKVEAQASTVVVNLADSPLSISQLSDALGNYPVPGLKRLYVMKNGEFKVLEGK